jgi:hypothetical protein
MDKSQADLLYKMFLHGEKVFKQQQEKLKLKHKQMTTSTATTSLKLSRNKENKIRELLHLFSNRFY